MKCSPLLILVSLQLAWEWRPGEAAEAAGIRFTKQGPVRGLRVEVRPDLGLGKVDAYLGLPYASPPMGQFRFMPPMSPQSLSPRVREAVEPPPVCPQVIPDLSDKNKALRYMTVGRYNYLTKLFAHLQVRTLSKLTTFYFWMRRRPENTFGYLRFFLIDHRRLRDIGANFVSFK